MPLPVGHRLKLICGAVAHEFDASLIHFAADNLGELVFFNAYRWHSGHVPREGSMPLADNPLRKRGEAVGFAAELKDGRWVLFRMCKGKHGQAPSLSFLAWNLSVSGFEWVQARRMTTYQKSFWRRMPMQRGCEAGRRRRSMT